VLKSHKRGLLLVFLYLSGDILTVSVADGSFLCQLAGKFLTFKAQHHIFPMGTGCDLTELIFFGLATQVPIGAVSGHPAGTLFAGDPTDTDTHPHSPSNNPFLV